nr:hypothetical protein [Tanacetum cinerariifolium]
MLLGKLTTARMVTAVEATTKVKTINEEEQIQAPVDKKKVIIIETSVRSDLHLEDAEDEHETTTFNDPLISGEDRLKLTKLMELCTQLQSRVLALETTKANQALEIESLKRRVKRLEKKARIALIDETQGRIDQDMLIQVYLMMKLLLKK